MFHEAPDPARVGPDPFGKGGGSEISGLYFYATRDDLLALCREIGARLALTYVPTFRLPAAEATAAFTRYERAEDIPDLSLADVNAPYGGGSFVVLPPDIPLAPKPWNQRPDTHLEITPIHAVEAVHLTPGGVVADGGTMLRGDFTNAMPDPVARRTMTAIRAALKRRFRGPSPRKIWIGPEAFAMLEAGIPLLDSPSAHPGASPLVTEFAT